MLKNATKSVRLLYQTNNNRLSAPIVNEVHLLNQLQNQRKSRWVGTLDTIIYSVTLFFCKVCLDSILKLGQISNEGSGPEILTQSRSVLM